MQRPRALTYVGGFIILGAMAVASYLPGRWRIVDRAVRGQLGTDEPNATVAPPHGGSRLHANYYVADDGSEQFAYFSDTAMNDVECAFALAGDGTLRCLPSTGATMSGLFADTGCTTPLATTPSTTCTLPAYAALPLANGCGPARSRLYPVTGTYDGPLYGPLEGAATSGVTSCVWVPPTSAPPGYTILAVGNEIPPATFQAASVRSE